MKNDTNGPLVLTPIQAAEQLGISRSTIYGLLAAGEIPTVRVGHRRRIPYGELRRWVEDRLIGRAGSKRQQPDASRDGGADV